MTIAGLPERPLAKPEAMALDSSDAIERAVPVLGLVEAVRGGDEGVVGLLLRLDDTMHVLGHNPDEETWVAVAERDTEEYERRDPSQTGRFEDELLEWTLDVYDPSAVARMKVDQRSTEEVLFAFGSQPMPADILVSFNASGFVEVVPQFSLGTDEEVVVVDLLGPDESGLMHRLTAGFDPAVQEWTVIDEFPLTLDLVTDEELMYDLIEVSMAIARDWAADKHSNAELSPVGTTAID